jgi:amino acid transporter
MSFWKVLVLALLAMQLGPNLAISAGYQLQVSGPASWLALGVAAVIAYLVAVTLGRLARDHEVPPTILSFAQRTLPRWAVHVTAGSLLVGYLIGTAGGVVGVTIYLQSLLTGTLGLQTDPTVLSAILICVTASLLGFCAYRGLDFSTKVTTLLGAACLPLAIYVTWAAARGYGFDVHALVSFDRFSLTDLAHGTFVALGFYVGFDGCAMLATETPNPRRIVPTLLMTTVLICGVVVTAGALFQTPPLLGDLAALDRGESPTRILVEAAQLPISDTFVDLVLAAAILAGLIAWQSFSASVLAAASLEGFMPPSLAEVHPRFKSPHRAVVLLSVIAAALPLGLVLSVHAVPLVATLYLSHIIVLLWLVPYILICAGAVRHREAPLAGGLAFIALVCVVGVELLRPIDRAGLVMNIMGLAVIAAGTLAFSRAKRTAAPAPATAREEMT